VAAQGGGKGGGGQSKPAKIVSFRLESTGSGKGGCQVDEIVMPLERSGNVHHYFIGGTRAYRN